MALVAYITTVGAALLSECVGNTLVFTKAELGNGGDQVEVNCRARTSLASKQADAGISNVQGTNGSCKVTVQYMNSSQQSDISVKEIGIYGKKQGSSASDTLICYANFGSSPDVIQAASAAQFARLYEVIIAVTGVAAVTVSSQSGVYQPSVLVSGILKGDGLGGITAAVAGTDYAAVDHTHALTSASITGELPIAKGGTGVSGASTVADVLAGLGVIYSATEPTYQAGAIWLQPVD